MNPAINDSPATQAGIVRRNLKARYAQNTLEKGASI